jgi:hypothetical protein
MERVNAPTSIVAGGSCEPWCDCRVQVGGGGIEAQMRSLFVAGTIVLEETASDGASGEEHSVVRTRRTCGRPLIMRLIPHIFIFFSPVWCV